MSVCEALGAQSIKDLVAAKNRLPRGLDPVKFTTAIEYIAGKELLPASRRSVMQEPRPNAQQKPWEKSQPNWMKDRKTNERHQAQSPQGRQSSNRDGRTGMLVKA